MGNDNKLLIVPKEQEVFETNIQQNINRLYYLQKFSDIYKLGYNFEKLNYQTALDEIVSIGNIVITTEEDISLVTIYLPDKITDNQYNYLQQNKLAFNKYIKLDGYSLQFFNKDCKCWKKISTLEELVEEAKRKYVLIEKGMGK